MRSPEGKVWMSSIDVLKVEGMSFYQAPAFAATGLVEHGFTGRAGGVSEGPHASLNMAFSVGDRTGNVIKNRERACRGLGMDCRKLVAGRQVHGEGIEVVSRQQSGRGALSYEDCFPDTDALITGVPGLPLASFYADCVPLFFLDPEHKVVALAHAGWWGTVFKIGLGTVNRMAEVFGTDPKKCLAWIGPSIGPCCYEVDARVMDHFTDELLDGGEIARPRAREKWLLNLWEANRRILLKAGLRPDNITVAGSCTACHTGNFFSYRAQGGVCGRMAALIMLKDEGV